MTSVTLTRRLRLTQKSDHHPDSELQLDSACASGFSSGGEDTTRSNSEDSSGEETGGESEPEYD